MGVIMREVLLFLIGFLCMKLFLTPWFLEGCFSQGHNDQKCFLQCSKFKKLRMKPFSLSWIFLLGILFPSFLKGNIKSKTYLISVDHIDIKIGRLDIGITSFEILFFIFWCCIFWQKAFGNGKCKPFLFLFISMSYHAFVPKTCNVTFGDLNWEFLFGCVVVKMERIEMKLWLISYCKACFIPFIIWCAWLNSKMCWEYLDTRDKHFEINNHVIFQ
jgi:hypothetical protein